jgi:hypothetical protein
VSAAFLPYLAGLAYMAWLLFRGLGYLDAVEAGIEPPADELEAWMHSLDGLDIKIIACRIVGIVVFCCWVYRVASNLLAFDTPHEEAPGMAVAWFFVPIALLWKPYQSLKNVWNGSGSDGTPWFFPIWWALWITSVIADRIVDNMISADPSSVDEARNGLHWGLGYIGLIIVALVFMLAVVWSLTRRQEQRGADPMPRATAV